MEFLAQFRNLVALAYLVPPERVRALVPPRYALEPAGAESKQALIATFAFSTDPLRPALFPFPKLRYDQVTFRVYVRESGKRGVYFLRTYVSNWQATAMVMLSPTAVFGKFESRFAGERILVRAESGGRVCQITGRREPAHRRHYPGLGSRDQAVLTVTQVLDGFMPARVGMQLRLPVQHVAMDPDDFLVENVLLDEWAVRGVLSPEEMQSPAAAFFQPEICFRLFSLRQA